MFGVLILTCLADVEAEPVQWLWPTRMALGKLTMLAGDPGLGKSFVSLDMAARVSSGFAWPDCPNFDNPAGGVVLISAEDDLADTIRPRLDAAGADVGRIVALQAVRKFDPKTGKLLENQFNLAEVRTALAPLSVMAAKYRFALVAVTHLRKGEGPTMYRAMGSLAFVAAARAAYAFAKDPEDPTGERRLMLPVKNNVGDDKTGMAYRISDDFTGNGPRVAWEDAPVTISADHATSAVRPKDEVNVRPQLAEAMNWLEDVLNDGPVPAKEVLKKAREDGIAKRTLDRAKQELDVETYREGFGAEGAWMWRIKDGKGRQGQSEPQGSETLATNGNVGDLWENTGENVDLGGPGEAKERHCSKERHAHEGRHLCPDTPGPTDLLTAEQYGRYRETYEVHEGEPSARHSAAWRAALVSEKTFPESP